MRFASGAPARVKRHLAKPEMTSGWPFDFGRSPVLRSGTAARNPPEVAFKPAWFAAAVLPKPGSGPGRTQIRHKIRPDSGYSYSFRKCNSKANPGELCKRSPKTHETQMTASVHYTSYTRANGAHVRIRHCQLPRQAPAGTASCAAVAQAGMVTCARSVYSFSFPST